MWERAPRWVRWAIGIVGGTFAAVLGLMATTFVLLLLAFRGFDLDLSFGQPDPNPELTAAIRRCDVDGVEEQISKGGRPFVDGRYNNYDDGPDLTEALACGPAMADLLLAYAVENGGGDSILHAAVALDDAELAARTLDAGVDVDVRDDAGDTALLDAVTEGKGAIIELLLSRGADPDVANDSAHTPLFRAVGLDRPLVVARLLAAGADPNLPARVTTLELLAASALRADPALPIGTTPFQDAIDALREPLGYPMDTGMPTIEPLTTLYLAVALSSDEVVVALLDAGADPAVGSGPAGHRPADAAELLGRTELAQRIRGAESP